MRKYLMYGVCLLAISAWSTAAEADGWGQVFSKTGPIYTETLPIHVNNGKSARAKIEYDITATIQILEKGSARGADTRNCYFNGQPGILTRIITLTYTDGTTYQLGTKTEALPPAPSNHYGHFPNDNCGKHYPGDFTNAQDSYIGSKAKWQSEIDADDADVKTFLSLIGTIQAG